MSDVLLLLAHPDLQHSRVHAALRAAAAARGRTRRRALGAARPLCAVPRLPDRRAGRAGGAAACAAGGVAAPDALVRHAAADEAVGRRGVRLSAGPTGPAATAWPARTCGWWPPPAAPRRRTGPTDTTATSSTPSWPPYEQTAALAGMRFLPPMVLHGAHRATRDEIDAACRGVDRPPAQLARLARDRRPDAVHPGRGARGRRGPPPRPREPRVDPMSNWLILSLVYLAAAVIAVPLARFAGPGLDHRLPGRRHRDRAVRSAAGERRRSRCCTSPSSASC